MMTKNLFKKPIWYLMVLTAGMLFTFTSCDDDDDPVLNDSNDITSFVFNDLSPAVSATISGTTITAEVPYDADITSLTPTIEVSDAASVSPASGTTIDFTNPVTFTVTAEDGTTQDYTATITVAPIPTSVITPVWERTLASGGLPEWFTANNDRDIAASGDYVYVHNNNDKIRVLDITDGTDVMVRDTVDYIDGKENYASGNLFLLGMDVDSQGKILASNLRVGSADQFPWYVYKWDNKDAEQELLINYPTPEGYRLGENLAVAGDITTDAYVYVPGSGFGTESNEVLKFSISNGEANNTPEMIVLDGITNMGNAPDVQPLSADADANLIVTGTGVGIREYTSTGSLVGQLPESLNDGENAPLFAFALDIHPFELDGRKLIATTATDFTANAADAGWLYIIDYTDGWENITADNVTRYAFTPEGNIDTNFNGTGGVDVIVNGSTATVYAMITNFGVAAFDVTIDQ
ncbi:DUF5018 domain-containing protein [Mangrovivirga cuniculi]|uniref:DUF5018 domain-containing protein n=1 Tax=Mangrovivirga cuniculi TaxID=2715131 RepID=A0A4D7JX87_9BACT|nr:DUF5018 domain-containing protein [Mangrovivirga cuniculi]QCK16756.1 hypothetical protein DCC35_19470 [Mangrovivirga cuniculi]